MEEIDEKRINETIGRWALRGVNSHKDLSKAPAEIAKELLASLGRILCHPDLDYARSLFSGPWDILSGHPISSHAFALALAYDALRLKPGDVYEAGGKGGADRTPISQAARDCQRALAIIQTQPLPKELMGLIRAVEGRKGE